MPGSKGSAHRGVFIVAAFLGLAFCFPVRAAERIASFDENVLINPNASISVTEKIVYDFGDTQHHGIFRDIPVQYATPRGARSLSISGIGITDENGVAYKFAAGTQGNNEHIQIGDAAKLITGAHTYSLSYTIRGAINAFGANDELYWNVTGNGWSVPIGAVSARVELPQSSAEADIKATCYEGPEGSTAVCPSPTVSANSIRFAGGPYGPGEGLTVVVQFPKSLVQGPTPQEALADFLATYWPILFPLLVFAVTLQVWLKTGRDPKGKGTIIPEYDPPDGLTPAEVGTLLWEDATDRDISATVIHLAIRGYIKITRTTEKKFFFDSHDYLLEKLKPSADLENEFEKTLMAALFKKRTTGVVAKKDQPAGSIYLSDLKMNFAADAALIKDAMYQALVAKGYFKENPKGERAQYGAAGGAILVVSFIFMRFNPSGFESVVAAVSFIAAGIIPFLFIPFVSERTQKGVEAKEYIEGFKQYLSVVEADRLKFHDAPEKNPDRFEKILPYAMVLGVEKEWAKQFEGIYTQPPKWYGGYVAGMPFYPGTFVGDLNTFSSSAVSTFSAAAGGSSGFGGGGFSGGGFGGGGGGSW